MLSFGAVVSWNLLRGLCSLCLLDLLRLLAGIAVGHFLVLHHLLERGFFSFTLGLHLVANKLCSGQFYVCCRCCRGIQKSSLAADMLMRIHKLIIRILVLLTSVISGAVLELRRLSARDHRDQFMLGGEVTAITAKIRIEFAGDINTLRGGLLELFTG